MRYIGFLFVLTPVMYMSMKTEAEPLVHPWVWVSMFLLALNDHYLKYAYPSWLTGKLSDFAGLIFFPILLDVIVRQRILSVLLTGIMFALVKVTYWGNDLYNSSFEIIFEIMGWGENAPLIMDETDCLALIVLWIPLHLVPVSEKQNES